MRVDLSSLSPHGEPDGGFEDVGFIQGQRIQQKLTQQLNVLM